jgi:beta-glucanase (GH16 family)
MLKRNGEFSMTTASKNNSFVRDGYLYITPTLTSDVIGVDAIYNGYTLNLTDCTYNVTQNTYPTSTSATIGSSGPLINNGTQELFNPQAYYQACGAVSNSSTGTIISPIQSARLNTRNSASIKYGKVEVRAKLPSG